MTDMIENCCFASPSQTEPDTQTITRRALLAVLPMVLEQELSHGSAPAVCFLCRRQKSNRNCPELGLSQATVSYHIHAAKAQPTGCCTTAKLPWPRPMTAGWKQRTTDSDPLSAQTIQQRQVCERPGRYRRQHLKSAPAHGAPQKRTAHLSSSYEVRYILCVFLCIHQNGDQEKDGIEHHLMTHIDPQAVAPQPAQHPAVAAVKRRRQTAVPHIGPGKGPQQK